MHTMFWKGLNLERNAYFDLFLLHVNTTTVEEKVDFVM